MALESSLAPAPRMAGADGGACCVLLAVAGANRLNNGDGDLVALVGLGGVVVTFVLLLWWGTAYTNR